MYEDIVEVVEGGMHWANHYLAHQYRLLDIQTGTRASLFPHHATNAGQAFVRRNPVFVMGRPRDVEWVAAPPRRWPATAEALGTEKQPEAGREEVVSAQGDEVVD